MSYTINPNAKNRWARNAENTMDLSLETDASSVYLDNGRALEQEIGEGSMVSNVATIDNGMGKVIDGTYDGAYESCKMYGKTKFIDNDTQEILDSFVEGKNLSLIDVKMPILKNVGKNLINKATNTDGRFIWTTGEEYSDTSTVRTDFIRVPSNSTLYSNYQAHFFLYDRNKQYLGVNEVGNKNPSAGMRNTHVVDTNETYVRIYWDKTSGEDNQLTVSSTATSFEPYKTSILTTPEDVVLRKVGDVCDSYDALTGEYVQRIGEIVFDGSDDEVWGMNVNWSGEDYCAFWEKNTKDKLPLGYAICDKMPTKEDSELISNGVAIGEGWRYMYQNMYIFIAKSKLSSADINGLKQYLSQNPITVQYELATPITTIIEPSTIPFIYENGHIILESGFEGQSLLPTLEYSTVVNKTGLVENVAKTIQRQEKQITKLEQILIQNIINLDYNNTLLTLKNEMEEML